MKKNELTARFEETMRALTDGKTGFSVIAAFSGGADSTALLLLLDDLRARIPFELSAMHIHHGLRGEEADRDEAFCRSLCAARGIPYSAVNVDVRAYADKEKKGVEESARILRYEALERAAKEKNAYIAVGHHAGDLAETMLFRIARGCGNAGLSGIPEKRGRIIRPLLYIPEEELYAYLENAGQTYVVDSTNDQDDCVRNRIRHTVLPALREICPAFEKNAAELSLRAREDEEYLQSLLPAGEPDAKTLEAMPLPLLKRQVARSYARYFEERGTRAPMLEGVHIEGICSLITRRAYGRRLSLPGRVFAVCGKKGLRFCGAGAAGEDRRIPLRFGENRLWDGKRSVYLMDLRTFSEFSMKYEKIHNLFMKVELDSATMDGELFVRTVLPGDRVKSGGMTHRLRALLSQVCPRQDQRDSYPVVCDRSGVLWLPGRAPRDGCAANKKTDNENRVYILMGGSDYGLS